MGQFFSSSHLFTLVTLFLLYHQKIFILYFVLVKLRPVWLAMEFFFSFKIHCLQMLQFFQTRDGPFYFYFLFFFFSSSHLSTLVALFLLNHQKHSSHILFLSQLVLVCFTIKLFFSFKIHCLQMLLLFQTSDLLFIFIITLVYTCHAFSAVSSENIYPIFCFDHTSPQPG